MLNPELIRILVMVEPEPGLKPVTLPELPAAVQLKAVKGNDAVGEMFVVPFEHMDELAALVTEGLGLTVTL
jgi:hypothetical protein